MGWGLGLQESDRRDAWESKDESVSPINQPKTSRFCFCVICLGTLCLGVLCVFVPSPEMLTFFWGHYF